VFDSSIFSVPLPDGLRNYKRQFMYRDTAGMATKRPTMKWVAAWGSARGIALTHSCDSGGVGQVTHHKSMTCMSCQYENIPGTTFCGAHFKLKK
jgi:hypothetical protein